MSLRDDKQQNLQLKLDFSSALTGAARGVAGEETESSVAASGPESPAKTNRLMEEVCERENLKEALRQVIPCLTDDFASRRYDDRKMYNLAPF